MCSGGAWAFKAVFVLNWKWPEAERAKKKEGTAIHVPSPSKERSPSTPANLLVPFLLLQIFLGEDKSRRNCFIGSYQPHKSFSWLKSHLAALGIRAGRSKVGSCFVWPWKLLQYSPQKSSLSSPWLGQLDSKSQRTEAAGWHVTPSPPGQT